MFLLVQESTYLTFPCFAGGKIYCSENGDCQTNWDQLIKLQHPDRDTVEEKHSPHPPTPKKGSCLRICFILCFVILQTAALDPKDIKHFPYRNTPNKEVCGGQEEVIRVHQPTAHFRKHLSKSTFQGSQFDLKFLSFKKKQNKKTGPQELPNWHKVGVQ